MTPKRCSWVDLNNPLYVEYHDNEWGVPVHNDNKLFEMLILEGAQAGLSWATVLKKREAYRKLFLNFDPKKVAEFSDLDLERILEDASIIRNRLKIFSVRQNAKVFLQIQSEYGSFDEYIWKWTAT
jgi:DNA-3-methyladenine glycosylase I